MQKFAFTENSVQNVIYYIQRIKIYQNEKNLVGPNIFSQSLAGPKNFFCYKESNFLDSQNFPRNSRLEMTCLKISLRSKVQYGCLA